MKRIEITVDGKGTSQVETKGFTGNECIEASKFIEQALGKQVDMRTTAEFYSATTIANELRSSNGS